jgi:hypothetical protein
VLGGTASALRVDQQGDGTMCMSVPHLQPDGGLPDDAKERYVRVSIGDGVARGLLIVDLYDLGPSRGYRLVGLERPEP